jgi:hypothetical protein
MDHQEQLVKAVLKACQDRRDQQGPRGSLDREVLEDLVEFRDHGVVMVSRVHRALRVSKEKPDLQARKGRLVLPVQRESPENSAVRLDSP